MSIENKELLRAAVGRMAHAYQQLQQAKEDCETVVCAEIDLFFEKTSQQANDDWKKAMIAHAKSIAAKKDKQHAEKIKQAAEMIETYSQEDAA